MFPYINIGSLHLGTFGLLLWFAAVCATVVLHKTFERQGVDADALNIVTLSVLAGIAGAKLWHELQDPQELATAMHQIFAAKGAVEVLFGFLRWFAAGFAWYGGLLAGLATLMLQGVLAKPNGLRGLRAATRMLDLATVAAAVGYGVGRLGCLTSGDGDYGKNTTLPWGVHMAHGADQYHRALVPPTPADALVQPTPIYELLFALLIAFWLWRQLSQRKPLGWLTGEYLVLSGIGRFLVEFVRINPKIYFNHTMSNAQVAALLSLCVGAMVMLLSRKNQVVVGTPLKRVEAHTPATA